MLENNDLLLLSGNDLPLPEAQLLIHQPTIKEIALIGEHNFYTGLELLNFSKNSLSEEDRSRLEELTNFDVLIAILKERNAVMQKNRNCVLMILTLLFPDYNIQIGQSGFELVREEETKNINNDNFELFRKIINKMFVFQRDESQDFNPAGDAAKQIAEKFRKRHEFLRNKNEENGNNKIDILSRYVSILAVGEVKDINLLLGYTIFQLFDEFNRYQLKASYDINLKARLAGASDLPEVEDWMKDIHSENK